MLFQRCIVIVASILLSMSAQAGTKVLNVELGVSTVNQVVNIASAAGEVRDAGTNAWTKGPMLRVENPDLGIEGIKSARYIFDASGKLASITLTMNATKNMSDLGKSRFGEVARALSSKYKVVKEVRPFVGDIYARYSAPDTVIELDAPHISFDMELRYMTSAFFRAWKNGMSQNAQQQRDQEKAKF